MQFACRAYMFYISLFLLRAREGTTGDCMHPLFHQLQEERINLGPGQGVAAETWGRSEIG